ncbi:MAG: carboxylesterase [Spirochaetes bacterium]|nr:MAG: carboxylesterase [Spirochaetota bacterium]
MLLAPAPSLPLRQALPIHIAPADATEAFLLLHGFSGYPGEMGTLAEGLAAAGYAVFAPRFSGHGTCRSDLMLAKAEDWVQRAFDAYLDAKAEYSQVHVLGHSMGALLAGAVAIRFDAPCAIFLAPAFELKVRLIGLTRLAAPFVSVISARREPSAYDLSVPARVVLQKEYWSDVLVRPAAELERLRSLCRSTLPRLKSDSLVIVGDKDRTIPLGVAEYIKSRASGTASMESRIIQGGTHVFPFNEYAAPTLDIILQWIKRRN